MDMGLRLLYAVVVLLALFSLGFIIYLGEEPAQRASTMMLR